MGDCHEAMNFAGIHRLPVVFVCENNKYAISVPQTKQMAIENVADRAAGYGFEGYVVDGNDVLACYEVTRAAVDKARGCGHFPVAPPARPIRGSSLLYRRSAMRFAMITQTVVMRMIPCMSG